MSGEDRYADLDPMRTARTLRHRLYGLCLGLGALAAAGVLVRLAQWGVTLEEVRPRLMDFGKSWAVAGGPGKFAGGMGVVFGGIVLGILLPVLAGQRLGYRPAEEEGEVDGATLEEAARAVAARCAEMGFAADPEAAAASARGRQEVTFGARSERGQGMEGHQITARELTVRLWAEGGRFRAKVRVWFDDLILVDTGETDYCRDVALRALGRLREGGETPNASFMASVSLLYGLAACVPVILGPAAAGAWGPGLRMGHFLAVLLAMACGLIALVKALTSGGRVYGAPVGAAAAVLGALALAATLVSGQPVFGA
jgi:hypothetical protein